MVVKATLILFLIFVLIQLIKFIELLIIKQHGINEDKYLSESIAKP